MRKNDIIHLIESEIDTIKSAENRADVIISLLDKNASNFNIGHAIYGSSEDFFASLSAITDITPYVVTGIKEYIKGTKMKYMPINTLSTSDTEEINDTLEFIYKILEE